MIPIFILLGPIILDYAFFYALGDLALSLPVTGGLCNLRDDHLFTSRTNGALCRLEDARALTLSLFFSHPRWPCQSQSHVSRLPLWEEGRGPFLRPAAPPPPTNGNTLGENHASSCFASGRWLETEFTPEERTRLHLHVGRVHSSPAPAPGKIPESQVIRQVSKTEVIAAPSSLQLTSQVPKCTASFTHSLIHSLSTHIYQAPAVCQALGI